MDAHIPEIGKAFVRPDALAKSKGAEKYAADYYGDNLLWAGTRRAGVASGRIRGVDASLALSLPGVLAVLTGKDVPGTNRQGIVHKDQPVLADDKIRYCGDAVALVLADHRDTLKKAINLIKLDIEPLPAVFTVEEALKPDAPLVHENHPGGNVLLQAQIKKGYAEKELAVCDVIIEESFEVPMQAHAFLETENGVAWQEQDGRISMICSTQAPFRDRWEVGHALGISTDKLRISSPYLGGAFGGKDGATTQCFLALAALHAKGRPVKMMWDREENFMAGYKRHAAFMQYRLGARADGLLQALQCKLYYNTGAYAHLGGEVMALGMEHAGGPYRIPHVLVEGFCVYTNNPIAGAMRGFGVAQVSFAIERMMDLLAAKLAIEPLQLRKKNVLRRGDTNTSGVTMTQSTGLDACLARLEESCAWQNRHKWMQEAGLFKKRGVGVAAVFNAMGYGRGLPDSAIAKIELQPDGKIRVYNGVTDMGQGNSTAFVQIAGQILCQENNNIELVQPDTDKTLPSGSSSASRTTYTYGNALIKASEELRRKIIGRAALMLLSDRLDNLELLPGRIRDLATGREIPLAAIASIMPAEDRICISQFLMPVVRDKLETGKEFRIGFPHLIFSYTAHLAAIEVDELTGAIEVKSYCAATEAGQALNPATFTQQVQGAIAQGIGYALLEEVVTDKGLVLTADFSTYHIPGAGDVPEIESHIVQTWEPSGPYGMKGVGEVGTNGPLPAIANALACACDIHLTRSPLCAERVLKAMSLKKSPEDDKA